MWSNGRSNAALERSLEASLPAPIEIRPMRSARRLRLRFDERRGTLKLTCPARTSRRSALAWALDQREWIEAQIARTLPPEPFAPGATIPVEGQERLIAWSPNAARAPVLVDGELRCGGPEGGLERQVLAFLKRYAASIMSEEVAEYSARAGVRATAVSVGDAATRWGSCSSQGAIRLSWRLILASPNVRRYVVAHEVAHLKHLNHGPQFKSLEAELFGDGLAEARSALRRLGPRLRRVGRRR